MAKEKFNEQQKHWEKNPNQQTKKILLFLAFLSLFTYLERVGGSGGERKNPKQALQGQHGAGLGAQTHKL